MEVERSGGRPPRRGAPWPVRRTGAQDGPPAAGPRAGTRFGGRPAAAGTRAWPGLRPARAEPDAERDRLAQGMRLRRIFLLLMGTALAIAAVNVLVGTVGLLQEVRSRPLTRAEQVKYVQEEVAARWHTWPATRVFPEEVEYVGLGQSAQFAHRVGIAREVSCQAGLDAPVAATLAEYGCRTLLRATYVDQTATFVITVGVAVLRDEEARLQAAAKLPVDDRVGVRPVPFRGTVADRFGPAQRQRNSWVGTGPYLVFSTVGYADGRTREAVPQEEVLHSELWPVAQTVGGRIARALGQPPAEVPQCTQGNVC